MANGHNKKAVCCILMRNFAAKSKKEREGGEGEGQRKEKQLQKLWQLLTEKFALSTRRHRKA